MGITPFTKQIAEQFTGQACGGLLDLYVGYDEHALMETLCDYTTFQTPYSTLRLTKLPMGWTNAVPVFHDDVMHILQPEVPQFTIPYIDDVPVRGPATTYQNDNRVFKTILGNSSICHFVWEHFQNLNCIVQQMKYCGGTFSGKKSLLCTCEITVVGHVCTPEGHIPDPTKVDKVTNWGPCANLSKVRAFLGTIGVVCVFIKNFAHLVHPLISLTYKGTPFVFGPEHVTMQDALKATLLASPALWPIDYDSNSPVILGVDTSHIAIGFLLCQCDADNPCIRRYVRFSSITLNDHKSHFLQPKLELYHALRALKMYLIGVQNLEVEVDTRYIKGMLVSPDLMPSASMNHWIVSILLFHFTLDHVPGTRHGPDGLSQCPWQPGDDITDSMDNPEFNDWVDQVYRFMHFLNPLSPTIAYPEICVTCISETLSDCSTNCDPTINIPMSYAMVPWLEKAQKMDERLCTLHNWFVTMQCPNNITDTEYTALLRYSTCFFMNDGRLWKKDAQGHHKVVINPSKQLPMLAAVHDDLGHHGDYAMQLHLTD